MGFSPYFFTAVSLASNIAAAPSLIPLLFPAVTVPSLAKAGFSNFSFPGWSGAGAHLFEVEYILADLNLYGVISSFHFPSWKARSVFLLACNANSSWACRLMFQRLATFSAVSPMV